MRRLLNIALVYLAAFVALLLPAAAAETRIALVIGDASYQAGSLPTAANDAALVAQALRLAGFAVTGARNLDEASLRRTFRSFLDVLTQSGPDTIAAVYFAGYSLQLEGENYLLPTDAQLARYSDIPLEGLRLSDYTRALAELPLQASFVIVDAARSGPLALPDLAGGLAWVEPERNMMLAFNAAPGTAAASGKGPYGPYAKALAEMILQGDLAPADLFDRVRLRVHDLTNGGQISWYASKIDAKVRFLERSSLAPARPDAPAITAGLRLQPMRSLGLRDAYMVALLRDTLDGYGDFLAEYGNDPIAKRLRAALAARREAITWRRTYEANTMEAYQTYLERYPHGPHVGDSRRLLDRLEIAQGPLKFALTAMEVPPPPTDEQDYVTGHVLMLDDPAFGAAPAAPSRFLAPSPEEFVDLPAPPDPVETFKLGTPALPPLPPRINVMTTGLPPVESSVASVKSQAHEAASDAPAPREDRGSPEVTAAIGPGPMRSGPASVTSATPTDTTEEPPATGTPIAAPATTLSNTNDVPPKSLVEAAPLRGTETLPPAVTGASASPLADIPLPVPRSSTPTSIINRIPLPIPRSAALVPGLINDRASTPAVGGADKQPLRGASRAPPLVLPTRRPSDNAGGGVPTHQ